MRTVVCGQTARSIGIVVVSVGCIVVAAIRATTVIAAERVHGPLVVRLNNQKCEFIPSGRSRAAKQVHSGAAPLGFVATHKQPVGEEMILLHVRLGVAASAGSEELCRYVAYQMNSRQTDAVARAAAARVLAQINPADLVEFRHYNSAVEQALFADHLRAVLASYVQPRGLRIVYARFSRYRK